MKLVLISYNKSFGLNRIGGVDSYFRRIIKWFANENVQTEVEIYGDEGGYDFWELLRRIDSGKRYIVIYMPLLHRIVFSIFSLCKGLKYFYFISSYPESSVKRFGLLVLSFVFRPSKGYMVISPRLFRLFRSFGLGSQLVLPLGYDQVGHGNSSNRLTVGYFGRIDKGKGVQEFLELCEAYEKHDIHFSIFGYYWPEDNYARSVLKRIKALNNVQYVESQVDSWSIEIDEKLAYNLASTDILVLPYRTLNTTTDVPLLFMEAMSLGVQVLTNDLGDLYDLYGSASANKEVNLLEALKALKNKFDADPAFLKLESQRIISRYELHQQKSYNGLVAIKKELIC